MVTRVRLAALLAGAIVVPVLAQQGEPRPVGQLVDIGGRRLHQICAGYAWSDKGPAQDTIEQTMDDLHLLLQKTPRPPYVFPLGTLPLIALERGEGVDAAWHAQQMQLAALSTAGQHVSV